MRPNKATQLNHVATAASAVPRWRSRAEVADKIAEVGTEH
jgi:hypothetical protein